MTWSYGDWHEDMVALYDDSTDAVVCWLQKKGGVDPQHLPLIKAAPELLTSLREAYEALDFAQAQVDSESDAIHLRRCRRRIKTVIDQAEGRSDETTPD